MTNEVIKQIEEQIQDFQENIPVTGSDDMIQRVNKILMLKDDVIPEKVKILNKQHDRELFNLFNKLQIIEYYANKKNWNAVKLLGFM